VLSVVVVAAAQASPAADRVGVNASGRSSTAGFSKALFVDVATVAGYTRHSFDGDEGTWDGPAYHASLKPSSGGTTSIGWGVTFDLLSHVSAQKLAERWALSFSNWSVVDRGAASMPHVVGGRRVGTIAGVMLLTQSPGSDGAAFKSAFAFPLCKGVVGVAHFASVGGSTRTAGPNGTYVVDDGTDIQVWNRTHIADSLKTVSLDGYLPAAHVTATARGRVVSGRVTDCVGHPMPAVAVTVGSTHTKTTSAGAYSARVTRSGRVTVGVTAGGGTARRTVTVR